MPSANIGDKTAIDSGALFVKLESKNQQIQFRLVRPDYYFNGKHFIQNTTDRTKPLWDIKGCSRINEELTCTICERYFEITEPIKEIKKQIKELTAEDEKHPEIAQLEKQIKDIQKDAEPYKVKITFNYIILERGERGSQEARIFQVPLSIRLRFDELKSQGRDLLETDLIAVRTEKPGNYYTIDPVDSKDTAELTEKEHKALEKAADWILEDLVEGRKGTSTLAQEPEEDIPLPPEDGVE